MKKRNRKKAQAVAELAILGSLILLAFASLLTFAQRLEMQQQLKMEAFRKALSRAYARNSSVSYTLKKDVRFLNLLGGYREGQASSVGASANVMWVKGAPGEQGTEGDNSFAFYEVNNVIIGDQDHKKGLPRYRKKVYTHTGAETYVEAPVSIWREDVIKTTHYASQSKKDQKGSLITNKQRADLQETIENTLYMRFDSSQTDPRQPPGTTPPVYEDRGSTTITQGNKITYEREWQTPQE